MKRFISFLFTMVFATGVLFAGASTLSVDAKSSDLQVNSVPETVTENYQKYLDKKEALIEAGWQLSAEHLNADADIYWMEGLTPEGIYFRCFPYAEEEEDACAQVLASSTSSDYYSDLDTYWMDEDTYAYVVSLGTNPYGYAQKKTFVDG
ncbi:MAG: hypothetical protein K6G23_03585, partial [Lachnospiraceae bacterium]|nr:hypothetical protein [Lachnospiraceae bacterium]